MSHPDFAVLTVSESWRYGYANNTSRPIRWRCGVWLAQYHPDVGPAELDRQHIRGWLVEVRETRSSSTAWVGSLQSGTSAGGCRARARLSGLRL
jgi:hypothetical protein